MARGDRRVITTEFVGRELAQHYPGSTFVGFDFHPESADPVGVARHILQSLADDGTWLLVEPMAGESLVHNVNPVGRIFYSASPLICTPSARAQESGYALGNQVPDTVWRDLLTDAEFTRFRRAAETPFNRVFEARP